MSGIYISGMEMPKNCRQCNLMIDCDGCEGYPCYCSVLGKEIGYKEDVHIDKRRDDCPLVPVPDHGRLIDADALETAMFNDPYQDFVHVLAQLPTIIPAEEDKDG